MILRDESKIFYQINKNKLFMIDLLDINKPPLKLYQSDATFTNIIEVPNE